MRGMARRARGTRRVVHLDDPGATVTVELTWLLRVTGWRRKVRFGKRKGEKIPPAVDVPVAGIRRIRFRPAAWFWPGLLTIEAPGHGDHWTLTGRQRRSHKVRFASWRAGEMVMMLFALDLLTPAEVTAGIWSGRRASRLRDRMPNIGTAVEQQRRRRGKVVKRMTDDMAKRVPKHPPSIPRPSTPAPAPLIEVPTAIERAARAGHARAVGVPPPKTRR